MTRACLLLIFATRVSLEPQSYQHQVFLSHRSRDKSPVQSGFVFSQMNDHPAQLETFGNQHGVSLGDGVVKRYSDFPISDPLPLEINNSGVFGSATHPPKSMKFEMPVLKINPFIGFKTLPIYHFPYTGSTESSVPYTTSSYVEHSINYEISKSKAKHSDPLVLAKAKTDEMLNKHHTWPKYDFTHDFHIDNDDVKSSLRNTYEWWPYFVQSPYKYETAAEDIVIQKAKEKRYASDSPGRVIPVHESQEDYSADDINGVPPAVARYHRRSDPSKLSDNPVAGDEPFFSFVLNDYFESNRNDDPLTFKGVDWENEFDTMQRHREHDNYNKRENSNYPGDLEGNENKNGNLNKGSKQSLVFDNTDLNYDRDLEYHGNKGRNDFVVNNGENKNSNDAVRQSSGIRDKGYENIHNYNKHEHGNNLKENNKTDHKHSEDIRNSFKNFLDHFANNFGGEDHKRLSHFSQQKNKENGEKKKGFHRVYHKDEYQEDKEFYDNTGNSAKAEDSGGSVAHVGGLNTVVQSLGAAAIGNKADIINKDGSTTRSLYKNNQVGNDAKNGIDSDIGRYIDIARQTVNTNNLRSFH